MTISEASAKEWSGTRCKQSAWRRWARRVPYIPQVTIADCGAASLAMVLAYFGKRVRLGDVREMTGTGRDGVNALALIRAARAYGLRARGVRIECSALPYLQRGAILHWGFNHFVVLDSVGRRSIRVVDPGAGRRTVPMSEVRRSFTGVALVVEPTADFDPTSEARSALGRYLRQIGSEPGLLAQVALITLLLQAFALAIPFVTTTLVDQILPRKDYDLLNVLGGGVAILAGFYLLSSLVRSLLLLFVRTRLDSKMTLEFMERMIDLPFSFFELRPVGDLMLRINSNAMVREILTSGVLSGLFDGVLVALYLAILFAWNPAMGWLVALLGLAQVGVFLLTRRTSRELTTQSVQAQSKSRSHLVQMLGGMETLKACGAEIDNLSSWSNLYFDELNAELRRGRFQAGVQSVLVTLRISSPLVVLVFGGHQVLHGHLSLGAMLGLSAIAAGFLLPLNTLVSTLLQIQLLATYIERLEDVYEATPEQDATTRSRPKTLTGSIEVESVSFRYSATSPLVIRDVSLCIEPGQFVVIVGKSAGGKSTLARLLLGLYPPTEGRILFDGVDLRTLELRDVRKMFGVVLQHPHLFAGSIRGNIALGDSTMPLDGIIEAARTAEIHAEIMQMDMGYDTELSAGGASLSGGQRQRIALARALVRKPKMLLLDEATSALDGITENAVQRNLRELGCTRVVIAHRLSTVRYADSVIVVDGGRIVETGTHQDLLRRDGHYSRLVERQLDGSLGTK